MQNYNEPLIKNMLSEEGTGSESAFLTQAATTDFPAMGSLTLGVPHDYEWILKNWLSSQRGESAAACGV